MAMAGREPNARNLDPGIRLMLGELRDLRVEMRADRQRADEERRQERRQSDERFERAMRESRERFERVMRDSEERFEHSMGESRERFERAMRETQRAFRDIRTVGLSIVKTLNHHTRILQRIEKRLGGRGRWRPGPSNGRGGTQR